MTLLELALWKAKLDVSEEDHSSLKVHQTKKAKIDVESMRKERRIISLERISSSRMSSLSSSWSDN
jgi:hypothetical protein